ncbi:MAG: DUF488 family protein [Phycisphaerae bacterium]
MSQGSGHTLYSIGHSNRTLDEFLDLLRLHSIAVVADVRSSPYTRYATWFGREQIAAALGRAGISYIFLGKELGARPDDRTCYEGGRVDFHKAAARDAFQAGLKRITAELQKHNVAVMCAEKDPILCHRVILVSRNLRSLCPTIKHITADGGVEDNAAMERRLMVELGVGGTLFDAQTPVEELIERAYDMQGRNIAYRPGADEEAAPEPLRKGAD